MRPERQRAAGDEPGHARHRVQRQHERVSHQDPEHVVEVPDRERGSVQASSVVRVPRIPWTKA